MQLDTITDQFQAWGDKIVALIPNALLAMAVLLVFYGIGRIVRRIVQRIGRKISDNRAISNLFGLMAYGGAIVVGALIALRIMELDGAATSILAGAGIAGIAIGFAFQDIAANFISGIILAIQRPMKIGDLVETNDTYGTVRQINLRSTEIETLTGQYVHIPNKDILLNPLIDYSHKKLRRIDLPVGVAYKSDLEKVKKIAVDAVSSNEAVHPKQPIDLYFEEFGDSSINFMIRFWVSFRKEIDFLEGRSQAIIAIKQAFDDEGITIPFPMRTVEISNPKVSEKIKS